MNENAAPTFGCPHCRKRFVWKQELAGRAVRCTCGQAFAFPDVADEQAGQDPLSSPSPAAPVIPPSPKQRLQASDFDTPIPEEQPDDSNVVVHCPSCNIPMKASARVCLNCGFSTQDGAKVKTRVLDPMEQPALSQPLLSESGPDSPRGGGAATIDQGPPPNVRHRRPTGVAQALRRREDDQRSSDFVDIYLPLIFIALGLVFFALAAMHNDVPPMIVYRDIGLYLVFVVPMLLGALFLAARVVGINYGSLGIGLLKLTGLAMGPMALAELLGSIIINATFGAGFLFVLFLRFIIVGFALAKLFDLDLGETLLTVVFIIAIRIFFELVILGVLLAIIL